MKQCPECNEVFDDLKAFCDMDGAELVDQTDTIRAALTQANPSSANASTWVTGAIGGLIGVIVCILLYILFLIPGQQATLEEDRRKAETKETTAVKPSQVALLPTVQSTATETPSPTETESPAEETPSPTESPAAATTPPPAALNNGPIATGTREQQFAGGDRAIIKMKDGSTVEVDAAWEDAQGIWFRRSGLVSFVEKSRVEAITEPPPRKPATESKNP